jgi:hypothetical protein
MTGFSSDNGTCFATSEEAVDFHFSHLPPHIFSYASPTAGSWMLGSWSIGDPMLQTSVFVKQSPGAWVLSIQNLDTLTGGYYPWDSTGFGQVDMSPGMSYTNLMYIPESCTMLPSQQDWVDAALIIFVAVLGVWATLYGYHRVIKLLDGFSKSGEKE